MTKVHPRITTLALLFFGFIFGCSQQKSASNEGESSKQQGSAQQQSQPAQGTSGSQMSGDQQFITEAAQDNQVEIQVGKLAAQKASDPAVKRFAQKLADDHTKANQQLQSLPGADQVLQSVSLPEDKRQAIDQLSGLSGKEFDRAFIDQMVQDHEKAVSRFQEVASSATDPQVKQFASQLLPTLQRHLEQAKALQSRLSGSGGGSNRTQ